MQIHIRAAARSLLIAATFIALSGSFTSAEILDPDATTSNDGALAPSTRDGAANFSPSFEGAAGARAPMSAKDMAGYGARPATADDLENFRNAKPRRGGHLAAESVIGTDSRIRVTNTRAFPARATVFFIFRETAGGGTFSCTGWLVNRNTVVTAGHCVTAGNGGRFFPASTYQIAAGYNGTSAPYGVCGARRLFTNATWKSMGRDDFDYAAIKLDCNVGATTGWYGYTKAVARTNPITVEGYPGDKPSGTQWKMSGIVSILQQRRVFYKIDTFGGQSGSPVWRNINANCRACSVAIHAYGVYGSRPYSVNNHGTRIIASVFNNITAWKNAP